MMLFLSKLVELKNKKEKKKGNMEDIAVYLRRVRPCS